MKKSISIQTFLGLGHALLLVLSLGLLGYFWSRNEYRALTQEFQNAARERVSQIARIISHETMEHNQIYLSGPEYSVVTRDKSQTVVFVDRSGLLHELIPGSVSSQQAELFAGLTEKYPVYDTDFVTTIDSDSESSDIYAAAPVTDSKGQFIGTVCLITPLGDLETYLARARWWLLAVMFVVTLFGIGASTLLTGYFSRRFSRVQNLAATVASGDYNLRIPEDGPVELRELSHYLNQMAETLQEQTESRRILLANVTHELARPLAGLKVGIESLRKGAIAEPELADDLLVSMGQTVRRMEMLIEDITLAALPKTRPISLDRTAVAVEPFLQGVATRFWSLAESRGVRFKVWVEAGLPPVWADERRLNQILGNLVDNAIKFTSRGKTVRLSANCSEDGEICISVHDGGKGISAEDASHIFEPFYQGDTGRRVKQGIGLGLSIANQLTEAHGGSLKLETHPKGGAVATLILPAAHT